ncbi:MAG TPA: pilus assembly protein TadG-related protein, partial [Bacillota bacterium]|nr:pilus assembly protein TadG-related protein [Bacillota bacterium]
MKLGLLKNERGNVLIMVAAIMTVLFGIVALVVDVGLFYVERRAMVTAADAAVLAGARELAMSGDTEAAIEVARKYARENGATLTEDITVETITRDNQSYQALVANVGVNKEYYFGRLLGLTSQDIMAQAVATWGYPTSFQNILPIFYVLEEGDELPQGEVLLLVRQEDYASGNWGFLRTDTAGKKGIKDVRAGEESEMYFQVGDEITNATETGKVAANINSVETRMQRAKDPNSGVTMDGVIPIIREITGH